MDVGMDNNTYEPPPSHNTALICQEILFAFVCLVGLLGNTLVIYVVIRFSKMQTVTNMYIVNLAIADECFLIGIPFLIVTMIKQTWIFGPIMCKAYLILTSINQFTSSIFLFIMSADRYIAVCHPISSPKWRTPAISRIVSILAWTFSIVLMIPLITHARQIENRTENGNYSCTVEWDENYGGLNISDNMTSFEMEFHQATAFTLYTFVCSFFIPLCLILVFYCLVIQKLKTVGPKNKSKEKKKSHRKVTNLVLTVVTVYVCCWFPYWITQIAQLASKEQPSQFIITIHLVASCLSYSNSAMNPILYAFLSDNFKKSFLKACTCAANKDVNATLHLENSVFPRKHHQRQGSERLRTGGGGRATSICPNNEEEGDAGPLVSKYDASTSAITMTSRSNITLMADGRDRETGEKDTIIKNGVAVTAQPTSL